MAKVKIDPGHAPGNANKGPTGYYEYAGMWTLSNFLKTALERCNVQADLTRKENEDPSLQARGDSAKGYDLFISEHSNAFTDASVRGCEVFYSLRRPADREHAAALSAASAKLMGNNYRGAKTRQGANGDWYSVIRNAEAVGCKHIFLAESGFHTNRVDEAWLKQDSNLQKLAEVHAKVICGILGVDYVAPGEPASGELYRVQVGAYSVRDNAESMARQLRADGYDTYMVTADGFYKVQTGAFRVKGNADKLAAKLKKDGYDTYITTRGGQPVAPAPPSVPDPVIRKGSRVRVTRGARDFTGDGLASFVYGRVYEVMQLSGSRAVIGQNGVVTAAVNVKDLYLA